MYVNAPVKMMCASMNVSVWNTSTYQRHPALYLPHPWCQENYTTFEFWVLTFEAKFKCTQLNKRLYPNTRKQEDRKLCQIFLGYAVFKTMFVFMYQYHECSKTCYDIYN